MISSEMTGAPGLSAVLSTWTSDFPSSAKLGESFTIWFACVLANPPASTSKFTAPNCLVMVPCIHRHSDPK